MKKLILLLVCLVLALAVLTVWRTFRPRQPPVQPVAEHQPLPAAEPEVRYPVEPALPAETAKPGIDLDRPLPEPGQVDQRMREILAWLLPGQRLERFFVLEDFIQRFVVTVDSLPRRNLPATHLPTRPVPGKFLATGGEENRIIDPANYRRYDPYVRLAETVDVAQAVDVYVRFYPLFQKAYEGLGYPHGYFNDRLIAVIDHLLATPEVAYPIHLVQPKVVYYQFADPDLEALSAGRKILLRTGPENSARIKELLRLYRREIVARSTRG